MARRIPPEIRSAAALLGQRGGSRHTPAQIAARRENGRKAKLQPCTCGHGRSLHRWQADGSRKACKLCPCVQYHLASGT